MKKILLIGAAAILVVGLAAGGFFYTELRKDQSGRSPGPERRGPYMADALSIPRKYQGVEVSY